MMPRRGPRTGRARAAVLALAAGALAVAACAPRPRAIAYGTDTCARCRMTASDRRFGAEIVTRTGKSYVFDSVECMAEHLAANGRLPVHSLWVADFARPGHFVEATKAVYLRSSRVGSPMGSGVAAFGERAAAERARGELGGEVVGWEEVRSGAARAEAGGRSERNAAANPSPSPGRNPNADANADVGPGTGAGAEAGAERGVLVVGSGTRFGSVTAAVRAAAAGDTIVVPAGVYREPTIVVGRPVTLVGRPGAVLDGEGKRAILLVRADDVTVRGLTLRNVGVSYMEDRAAVKVDSARGCVIEGNRIEDAFFGIYLARTAGCRVARNEIRARGKSEAASGNGIHLWYSREAEIVENRIHGQRDGIYFEFVRASRITGNTSEDNLRYGLHFMFSDSCTYAGNAFRRNGAGVAVMYTKHVAMEGNHFEDNWGGAAFGLLMKSISDSRIAGNTFRGNTTGVYAESSNRLDVRENDFVGNGWAIRLMADCEDGRFTRNNFLGNSFDVATNSRSSFSTFEGNHWDGYRGYDLDHDGLGDAPYRPVTLFSVMVEDNEAALALLRSPFVELLDAAERLLPSLTPETLVDRAPALRAIPRRRS
ncbi:MAG TPA: nitrous oxide reductase family maturation protein NosD [Longimicrobiales bacterium]|nr:nitrous oxide reductase family maturation protein NosD [Longimicrobiales bacterium]